MSEYGATTFQYNVPNRFFKSVMLSVEQTLCTPYLMHSKAQAKELKIIINGISISTNYNTWYAFCFVTSNDNPFLPFHDSTFTLIWYNNNFVETIAHQLLGNFNNLQTGFTVKFQNCGTIQMDKLKECSVRHGWYKIVALCLQVKMY